MRRIMTMEILAEGARALLGLELTEVQLEAFQIYYQELADWNERTNLTAVTNYEEVQIRHFLDSLTLAYPKLRGDPDDKLFDMATANLLDIGAGAGFPGLPLKIIYPQLHLTLVDSVGKKTNFLTHLVNKLQLQNVTVLTGRAEDLGQQPEHRERYDVATGRAVAALPVLAEYCLSLCKIGGLFIAPKKADITDELASAQVAIAKLGGSLRHTPEFELEPNSRDKRKLIVVDKVKPTPSGYPRRAGLPAKRPIS